MPLLLLRISRLLAFALLALSILLPWFPIPISIREGSGGTYSVIYGEPVSTIIFKVFAAAILLGACWLRYRWRGCRGAATPMTVGGSLLLIAIAIAYPALTVQRCAGISAHAAWLEMQNYSIIQPSGDLFTAQEYAYQPRQPEVDVKQIIPRAFEALPTPVIVSFFGLHLAELPDILCELGFSPGFCQFVARGWFCGVFGSFLLVISFLRVTGVKEEARQGRWLVHSSIFPFVSAAWLTYALCLVPIVMAGRELAKARTAVVEGKFPEALRYLDLAQAWVPVLAYHTDLIYQRGWLERKLKFNSSAAQVFAAIREEEEGFTARAVQHYTELLGPDVPGPIRDEATRGVIRLAINEFNAGLIDRASFRFRQLVAIDPTCLTANYALQLADLRSFQKDQLERDVAKFEALYNCFQSLEKGALLAAAHRRLAELEFDSQDVSRLGDEMRAAIKP